MNKECLDNIIVKMISDSKGFDCSFIKKTNEFNELKSFFCFFFSYLNIRKINTGLYLCDKYIIKIKNQYQPNYLIKNDSLVNVYHKKMYHFKDKCNMVSVGVEIQDYIISDEEINYKDLFHLYSKLRDNNYIWLDVSPSNVIKNNGKIYIIDTDYIFEINDKSYNNLNIIPSELSIIFNKLYNEINCFTNNLN